MKNKYFISFLKLILLIFLSNNCFAAWKADLYLKRQGSEPHITIGVSDGSAEIPQDAPPDPPTYYCSIIINRYNISDWYSKFNYDIRGKGEDSYCWSISVNPAGNIFNGPSSPQTARLSWDFTNISGDFKLVEGYTCSGNVLIPDMKSLNYYDFTGQIASYYSIIFTPQSTQPPQISSIEPVIGDIDGSTEVTINGNNFLNNAIVKFGNNNAAVISFLDNKIICKAPSVNNVGSVDITVINPDNLSVTSQNAFLYKYVEPVADFAANKITGSYPLNVSFFNHSTGRIDKYLWDFGDNTTKSLSKEPFHIYNRPGTYNVSLYVEGPDGNSTEIKNSYITISECNIFIKEINADKRKVSPNTSINFSVILNEDIQSCQWDFGDGNSSTGLNTSHIYSKAGLYSITLTATPLDYECTKEFVYEKYIIVEDKATISGNVSDAENGSKIANCYIEVWHLDSLLNTTSLFQKTLKLLGYAKTDTNGDYTIHDVPSLNNLIVSAWPKGKIYKNQYYSNKDKIEDANKISTESGNIIANFSLAKRPVAGIKGKIHDKTNKGLQGIRVSAYSQKANFGEESLTDENGFYTITGLILSDDYKVSAWSNEFFHEYFYFIENGQPGELTPVESKDSYEEATSINVQEGIILNFINIIIDKGQITGRVLNDDNSPASYNFVKAWSKGLGVGSFSITDENGYYTITNLDSVTGDDIATNGYYISVHSLYYNNTYDVNEATLVGTGSSNIDFILIGNTSIKGQVVDNSGNPIPDVNIRAWSESKESNGIANSDKSGFYTITNLAPAKDFKVVAYHKSYKLQFYNNKDKFENCNLVNTTSGNVDNINFQLYSGAKISGQVFIENESTPAYEGIDVSIWSESTKSGGVVLTDSDGKYEISDVDENANDYIVSIWHPDYLPAFYNSSGTVSKWEEAEGIAASQSNINIILTSGYSIAGKIVYNNKPLEGVRVEAWSETNKVWSMDVSSSNLIDGKTNYKIKGLPNGLYEISTYSRPGLNLADETKLITISNASLDNIDFELKPVDRVISGTIYNLESGKKVRIIASPSDKYVFSRSISIIGTGNPINYTISDLKPYDNYKVMLYSSEVPVQYYNGTINWWQADTVDISSESASNINFTIPTTGQISGSITFPDSASIGDYAWVHAFSKLSKNKGETILFYTGTNPVQYNIAGLKRENDYIVSVDSYKFKGEFYNNSKYKENAALVDISSENASSIDLKLTSGVEISGIVYIDNVPAGDIKVEAWSDSIMGGAVAKTNKNGIYIIKGLETIDDIVVSAQTKESIPFYYNINGTVIDKSKASMIDSSETNTNINISITTYNNISGVVRNRDGQPIEGIWVDAISYITKGSNGDFTNENGEYVIKGLPDSTDYVVSATPHNSLAYIPGIINNISSGSSNVDFILSEGYNISGAIECNGETISGIDVEISSKTEEYYRIVRSDNSGNYTIKGLPSANDYIIIVMPDSSLPYIQYTEKDIVINSNIIKNINLMPASELSGYIYENDGVSPVYNAFITIFSANKEFISYAKSNRAGEYLISNIPDASDYIVTVHTENYAEQKKTDISPCENINFTLESGGTITGNVTDESGNPIYMAKIKIYSDSVLISKNAVTDESGNYIVKGLKGYQNGNTVNDYVVTIDAEGYPNQSKLQKSVGDVVNFVLTRGSENEINGTVKDLSGDTPPSGAIILVRVYESGAKLINKMLVDSNGSFSFKGLDASKNYQLKIKANNTSLTNSNQWAGDGNSGVDSRSNAIDYNTGGASIDFRFSSEW